MELLPLNQNQLDLASIGLLRDVASLASQVHGIRPLPAAIVSRLRKELLEESVYSSNAIEGSTLTLRETIAVLETGQAIDVGRERESQESLNLYECLIEVQRLIDQMRRDRLGFRQRLALIADPARLLSLHGRLLKKTQDEIAGHFRDRRVMLRGAKHQPPSDDEVPGLISGLFSSLVEGVELDPLYLATWTHWALARIHPFADGNGRMARLWQDLILFSSDLTAAVLPLSARSSYYSFLQAADDGDINPLLQFIAVCELSVLQRTINAAREQDKLADWAETIARERVAGVDPPTQLTYCRWKVAVEGLLDAIQRCCHHLQARSPELQITLRSFPIIEVETWDAIRTDPGALQRSLLSMSFSLGNRWAQYVWRVAHRKRLRDDPPEIPDVPSLIISEFAPSDDDYVSLSSLSTDGLSSRPELPVQIIADGLSFSTRRYYFARQQWSWDRGIDPMSLAQSVLESIVRFRLAAPSA
jgi:Fic family protein